MAFLPCVEVIPEHTERAARIKQSRVKNDVILKAKNQIGRERERQKRRESSQREYIGNIQKGDIQIEQFDRGLYIEKDEKQENSCEVEYRDLVERNLDRNSQES